MKNIFFVMLMLCCALGAVAQQIGFTYQAVALDESKAEGFGRDSKGQILLNQPLKVRFSIHEQSADGTVQYQEVHETTTDIFGIFRVVIGSGEKLLGTSLETLQWSDQSYFMQVEIDLGDGFINMGEEVIVVPPFGLNNSVQLLNLSGTQVAISEGNSIDLGNLLSATRLSEAEVDAFVNNNGYLLLEVDGSVTNELQTLLSNGTAGHMAISDGNQITINVNDADADPLNEIQDLQLSSNQLTITNNPAATIINLSPYLGNNLTEEDVDNMVANNGYLTTEVDGSITNEIQDLNLTGNTLTITNNPASTNIDLSPYRNVFETTSGVTSNENGSYATDDFVYGSSSLDHPAAEGQRNRLFFDKSKGALRAGSTNDASWNDTNRGFYSTAFGFNNIAIGISSFSTGEGNTTSGAAAISLGAGNTSSGSFSLSGGTSNNAIGYSSIALGFINSAYGHNAIAMGDNSVALGDFSKVFAHNSTAYSYGETVLGTLSTAYTPVGDVTPTDRLLTIGNGTYDFNSTPPYSFTRSDALVMLKSGAVTFYGPLSVDADNVTGAGEPYTLPGQDGAANQVMTTDGNGNVSWNTPTTLTETDVDNFVSNNGYLTTETQDLNLTGNLLSITNNAAATNIDLTPFQNVFETTNSVTSNENGNYATDDFVFGSPQMDDDDDPNHDTRMFFDKSKGAFRVGTVNEIGGRWDDNNRGSNSFAVGFNTTASGTSSMAMGYRTISIGFATLATGYNARAFANYASSLGQWTIASGQASFASGLFSTASGVGSTSLGAATSAHSYGETALGIANTLYTPTNTNNDRILVIGNGTVIENNPGSISTTRSDALVMLKNGNTRLHGLFTIDADNVYGAGGSYTFPGQRGTNGQVMVTNGSGVLSWSTLPAPAFSTTNNITSNAPGNYASDSFIFGSPNLDYMFGTSNYARAMSFNKSKGSFRAGHVLHNGNGPEVGLYSVAFGRQNSASGEGSAAFGFASSASGSNSFASGGLNSTASGESSASFGYSVQANGNYSFASGYLTRANSRGEVAFGIANTDVPGNGSLHVATDRLFSIGNGINNITRSDAFVMLKNGNTRLHGLFTIDADNVTGAGEQYTLPGQDGAANQVMTTDGNGNVSWSTPTTLTETDVDNFVSNNGYLTTEVDGSITNEIQDLNLTGNLLSITNNAAPTNIDLTPYQNVFETTNNVTSNENGNYATDDFVFGSPQLADDGNVAHDARMFFDKSKSAFRAGMVSGTQWDDTNVGVNSIAMGLNVAASRDGTISIGTSNVVSSNSSIALGRGNSISDGNEFPGEDEYGAIALGIENTVSGERSTGIGIGFTNNASSGVAVGTYNSASLGGIALGFDAIANNGIAIGITCRASNNGTAIGYQNQSYGAESIALGSHNIVRSYAETVIGLNATDVNPIAGDGLGWNGGDRLFVIGNGFPTRSDALVMLKSGAVTFYGPLSVDADNVTGAGEPYTLPGQDGAANQVMTTDGNGNVSWNTPATLTEADVDNFVSNNGYLTTEVDGSITNEIQDLNLTGNLLSITNNAAPTNIDLTPYQNVFETTNGVTSNENGSYTTDSFVIGSPSLDDDGDATHDTRMFFEKSTGAFRVGTVTDTRWDAAERGTNSVAMGLGNIARGGSSLSLGQNNLAHSASSVAIGTNNVAEGYNSVALGRNVATTGVHSMALSLYSASRSYGETTMGIYAADYVPNSTTNFDGNDRLFTIGNGLDDANRSNAFVILKNGDATLLGTLTDASDMRLKRNIKPLQNSLFSLNNLQGVHYQWNGRKPQDTLALQTGLIAQEVEKIFPELVKTDEEGFKSVNYIGVIPHLIEAIKELKKENEELKSETIKTKTSTEQKIAEMEAKLMRIEALMEKANR